MLLNQFDRFEKERYFMRPKILIVDDLIENLISLEAVLDDFDIDIVRATSGEEALKRSLKDEFALVILDVQMPGMNGYETLEMMRQRKKTRYLPVVFVSAIHQSDLHIIKGIETGAVDFIPKPIIPNILRGKVRVFLDLYMQRVQLNQLLTEMEQVNVNLKIAKEKAEEATRTKAMFLANMSHEIRTPLNGVIGLTKLLQKSPLNDEQQEMLNIICNSGDNLMNIINDILDFSKIESGQIQLETISFDLKEMIDNVFQLMKFKADEQGINFQYVIEPDVPAVLCGDPLRINQILLNLVNNAIKFTPQGKVRIMVRLLDTYEDMVRLLFRVVDTGIGISDEGKAMLFKEFSQSEASISREYGGTGLGLAISQNLVSLMNGEIGVNSQLGQGAEFWFRIPLKLASQQEARPTDTCSVPAELRILLAEDNKINQKVSVLQLKQLGYSCDIAGNGRQAVEMCRQNGYDVVLMDMQMPELDGLEACRLIRRHEKENRESTPVYIAAVTASSQPEDRRACMEAGMNNFMSKPFPENELIAILQEAANGLTEPNPVTDEQLL
ncbi:signal transduction histidine kinase [Mangrovibacterium marinum]|uniref:histidine kinase n=2 Tax=Mangrovibacterium marinum TaxID=1639118 RepID=A0A2T5C4N9_9BACT|nr:signal transduction histidine kinase [Mangrovibacterium marinum]